MTGSLASQAPVVLDVSYGAGWFISGAQAIT